MPGVTDWRSHWGHYVRLKLSNSTRYVSTFKLQSFSKGGRLIGAHCLWHVCDYVFVCFRFVTFKLKRSCMRIAQQDPTMSSCPLPRFLPNAFHCLVLAHCDNFLPIASFVCLFAKINWTRWKCYQSNCSRIMTWLVGKCIQDSVATCGLCFYYLFACFSCLYAPHIYIMILLLFPHIYMETL